MIDVEDWAEIRRLHRAERMSINAIADRLGIARNTVRKALRSTAPPKYERARTGSLVDAVEAEVRGLLAEFPLMPTMVIAERIGWVHGMTILNQRVRELRPLFLPPDPVQRTSYRPGELAQWDLWQPDVEIPVGFDEAAKLWTVVAVSGFSRVIGRGPSARAMVEERVRNARIAAGLHISGSSVSQGAQTEHRTTPPVPQCTKKNMIIAREKR